MLKLQIGSVIEERFKLIQQIGQGSFGIVYLCYHLNIQTYCVCKIEPRSKTRISMMNREILVMKELVNIRGFPQLIHHGRDRQYTYFMSTMLGNNLETVMRRCGGRFSIPTVLQVAIQLIDRLEVFHSKNLIHRDVKPENFVISKEDNTLIYLIDFGLAKFYRSKEGRHIEFSQKQGVIGTARYASINALQWMEQSRRDDLEAVGYMLVYFAIGQLPWQNVKATNKEAKYEQILQMKMGISLSKLCQGLPRCFLHYFQHVKSLLFQQQPNYSLLRTAFEQALNEYDNPLYDWEQQPESPLLNPDCVPDILYSLAVPSPPVEEEGEAIHMHDDLSKHKKFMRQLHEKYDDQPMKQEQSQATSKQMNYQTSYAQSANQPQQQLQQFTKRKDSKAHTTLQHKENRRRISNEEYEINNDDIPNLQLNALNVKFN